MVVTTIRSKKTSENRMSISNHEHQNLTIDAKEGTVGGLHIISGNEPTHHPN